mmetsp:Transcript_44640/g.112497  ORF Transcript_44640/g.112497 Transcript_44640/m.112497 type:complete len:256 (-) Transcript_44640:458-1225(-)
MRTRYRAHRSLAETEAVARRAYAKDEMARRMNSAPCPCDNGCRRESESARGYRRSCRAQDGRCYCRGCDCRAAPGLRSCTDGQRWHCARGGSHLHHDCCFPQSRYAPRRASLGCPHDCCDGPSDHHDSRDARGSHHEWIHHDRRGTRCYCDGRPDARLNVRRRHDFHDSDLDCCFDSDEDGAHRSCCLPCSDARRGGHCYGTRRLRWLVHRASRMLRRNACCCAPTRKSARSSAVPMRTSPEVAEQGVDCHAVNW